MLLGVLFAWNKVGGEQLRVNKIHAQKDSVISQISERICGFSSSNKFFLFLLKQFNSKQDPTTVRIYRYISCGELD